MRIFQQKKKILFWNFPTNMNIHYFDPEAFGNIFKTIIQWKTFNAPNAKSEGEITCRGTTASLAIASYSSLK